MHFSYVQLMRKQCVISISHIFLNLKRLLMVVCNFQFGGSTPSQADLNLYEKYAHQQQLLLGIIQPDIS